MLIDRKLSIVIEKLQSDYGCDSDLAFRIAHAAEWCVGIARQQPFEFRGAVENLVRKGELRLDVADILRRLAARPSEIRKAH